MSSAVVSPSTPPSAAGRSERAAHATGLNAAAIIHPSNPDLPVVAIGDPFQAMCLPESLAAASERTPAELQHDIGRMLAELRKDSLPLQQQRCLDLASKLCDMLKFPITESDPQFVKKITPEYVRENIGRFAQSWSRAVSDLGAALADGRLHPQEGQSSVGECLQTLRVVLQSAEHAAYYHTHLGFLGLGAGYHKKISDLILFQRHAVHLIELAVDLHDKVNKLHEAPESLSWSACFAGMQKGFSDLDKQAATLVRRHRDERAEVGHAAQKTLKEAHGTFDSIRSLAGALRALEDVPETYSDGLSRTQIYYQSPEMLRASRVKRGLDPEVCDVVVIGGGPAGIATSYHLGRQGIDTVLFEGSFLGRNFTDAGAGHTHELRTSAYQSSLARDRIVSRDVLEVAGMQFILKQHDLGAFSELARKMREAVLGQELGSPHMTDAERLHPEFPATRAQEFASLQRLAQLAQETGNVALIERTRVENRGPRWDEREKLFTIETDQGHSIKARNVVFGTGLVGLDVSNQRSVPLLSDFVWQTGSRAVMLSRPADLRSKNDQLSEMLDRQALGLNPEKQLIISDSLLRQPKVESLIRGLPAGTSVMIVGGGESAAKATIDIISQNPGVVVELYCKDPIVPYQIQYPLITRGDEPFERALFDSEFAEITHRLLRKVYGTAITPRTMQDIYDGVARGQIRIFEMGAMLDSDSVQLKLVRGESGVHTEVAIRPERQDIRDTLAGSERELLERGLITEPYLAAAGAAQSRITGPIVYAAGYDARRAAHGDDSHSSSRKPGVVDGLFSQGQIQPLAQTEMLPAQFEQRGGGHLASAANAHVFFVGAPNPQSAHDSNLTGIGVRALHTANEIAAGLKSVGVEPEGVQIARQMAMDERRASFQHADDLRVTELAKREADGVITPSEQLVLDRFLALQSKLNAALYDVTIDPATAGQSISDVALKTRRLRSK